jgi:hypothetical protein
LNKIKKIFLFRGAQKMKRVLTTIDEEFNNNMNSNGFHVFRRAFLPPSPDVLSGFTTRVAAAADPIFNGGGNDMMAGVATGDNKRKQAKLFLLFSVQGFPPPLTSPLSGLHS